MKFRQFAVGELVRHPLTWMTVVSSAWAILLAAAPVAPTVISTVAYALGAMVCHQIPERSFHLADAQLAVCARCSGIYGGGTVVFLLLTMRARGVRDVAKGVDDSNTSRRWLLLGALPTILTVACESLGLWSATNGVRFVAGMALGVALGLVAGGSATLHYERWRQRRLA